MTLSELESCGWDAETIMLAMLEELPKSKETFLNHAGFTRPGDPRRWWSAWFQYEHSTYPGEYPARRLDSDEGQAIGMVKYYRGRLLTCYVVRGEK